MLLRRSHRRMGRTTAAVLVFLAGCAPAPQGVFCDDTGKACWELDAPAGEARVHLGTLRGQPLELRKDGARDYSVELVGSSRVKFHVVDRDTIQVGNSDSNRMKRRD